MNTPGSTLRSLSKTRLIPMVAMAASLLSSPASAVEPAVPAAEQAKLEALAKNHTYRLLVGDRSVALKNGAFSDESSPEKAITASLVKFAASDLNDDGKPDCVVIIEHHGMGSGAFFELSALVSRNSDYLQIRPVLLGDNVEIRNLEISDFTLWKPKEITVDLLVHQGTDAHAKPTQPQQRCFYLDEAELSGCEELPIVKKPAVYLYPEKTMRVKVHLSPKGKVVKSIPEYGSGWTVNARPDGSIDGRFSYLFYEASLDNALPLPEEGWSVKRENLGKWFDKHLKKLGLNRQEAKDLQDYWLQNLPKSPWVTIRAVDPAVVSERLGLTIDPKPESVLRLLLHFTPTNKREQLKSPIERGFLRKGFTVVEWGGLVGKEPGEHSVR